MDPEKLSRTLGDSLRRCKVIRTLAGISQILARDFGRSTRLQGFLEENSWAPKIELELARTPKERLLV